MEPIITIEQIAIVCHEANRSFRETIGEDPGPSWANAPQSTRDSAIAGVTLHLDKPETTAEESHAAWLEFKRQDGWKHGPVKNEETKEHPCFLPYNDLPAEQRAKDYLFKGIVEALKKAR